MKMKIKFLLISLALESICNAAPLQQPIDEDPELTAGYFEGDMVLDDLSRNGLRNQIYKWPNNVVYYYINDHFDEAHRNHILRGMRNIEAVSCIRFKEVTPDHEYYVNITGLPEGCYSSVGFSKNVRRYNLEIYPLDSGCFRLGTIMHELLHTLGFYHMQSATNRDEYVHIAVENIREGTLSNFNKLDEDVVDAYDEEYDYGSVLHYSAYAFSVNKEMTIIPLKDIDPSTMGQRREMSSKDINKLNTMYRCPMGV